MLCENESKSDSIYCEEHDDLICQFDLGWIGRCKHHRKSDSIYCEKHDNVKCVCCGKSAVRICAQTYQGSVCDSLICETCDHELDKTGCNVTWESHIKEGEPRYLAWYAQCVHRNSFKFDENDTICIHLKCDKGEPDGRCKHYTRNACQSIRDYLKKSNEREPYNFYMTR